MRSGFHDAPLGVEQTEALRELHEHGRILDAGGVGVRLEQLREARAVAPNRHAERPLRPRDAHAERNVGGRGLGRGPSRGNLGDEGGARERVVILRVHCAGCFVLQVFKS